MSEASWRFVDRVAADASVILDLHDGAPFWVSSWEAPPPEMIVAAAQSPLVDGSLRTSESFGDRTLSLRLDLQTPSADQTAAAFQRLARVLLAPQWLRYQPPSTTAPVFFRTKPSTPAELEEYRLLAERNKEIQLEITADPFSCGLKESGTITLPNDPTDMGMRFALTSVKGDVSAPLRLACQFAAPTDRVLIGTSPTKLAHDTGTWLQPNDPEFFNGLVGGWTADYVSDSTAIRGTRHVATVTAQNSAMGYVSVPARLSVPAVEPGDYRLLVRMKIVRDGGDQPGLPIVAGLAAAPDWPGASWSDSYWDAQDSGPIPWRDGTWQWVDLGVMRLPGYARRSSLFDPAPGSTAKIRLLARIRAATTSVGGEVSLDHAVLVPAPGADGVDGRLLVALWNLGSVAAQSKLVVAEESGAYTDVSGGASIGWSALGGFPRVTPGLSTTVTIVPRLNQGADSKTSVTTVDWSYFPRYLYLRGD